MHVCEICKKGQLHGNYIRHKHSGQWKLKAQRKKRAFRPNLQTVRVALNGGKTVRRLRVCTRCIRTGRVQKV